MRIIFFLLILLSFSCSKKQDENSANKNITKKPLTPVEKISYSKETPPKGMVFIHCGTFKMGSSVRNHYDRRPVHEVSVSSLYMDSTEVTQADYAKLIHFNYSHAQNPDNPVERVSWYKAIEYCNARSKRDGFDTIYTYLNNTDVKIDYTKTGYRLPTEAEWEYTCRAGTSTKYYWGDTPDSSIKYEWINTSNSPQPGGLKVPNRFGLYDMLGNVEEWCSDWFFEDYYEISPSSNPVGPQTGKERVIRGGTYSFFVMCSYRYHKEPYKKNGDIGFRCVLPAPEEDFQSSTTEQGQ